MFKDIQVGEKALHVVFARDADYKESSFFIPITVKKVTAKRIKAGDRTYKKSNGADCEILDWILLPFIIPYSKEKDQSEEYKKFITLAKSVKNTRNILRSLEKKIGNDCSVEYLQSIFEYCNSMIEKVQEVKK